MTPADELAFRHLLWRLTDEELKAQPLLRCIAGGDLVPGDVVAYHGEVLAIYPHPEFRGQLLVHVVRRGREGWVNIPAARQTPIADPGPDDPRGQPIYGASVERRG